EIEDPLVTSFAEGRAPAHIDDAERLEDIKRSSRPVREQRPAGNERPTGNASTLPVLAARCPVHHLPLLTISFGAVGTAKRPPEALFSAFAWRCSFLPLPSASTFAWT